MGLFPHAAQSSLAALSARVLPTFPVLPEPATTCPQGLRFTVTSPRGPDSEPLAERPRPQRRPRSRRGSLGQVTPGVPGTEQLPAELTVSTGSGRTQFTACDKLSEDATRRRGEPGWFLRGEGAGGVGRASGEAASRLF